MRRLAILGVAVLSTFARPASAVESPLSQTAVDDAVEAGRAMADAHGGYTVAPYLLFTVPDAVLIRDDNANVEAVELGTPFERLRFEAYREQATRIPFNAADIATFDDQHAGRIDFIVYAHSRTENARAFLERFSGGALVQRNGSTVSTATILRSVPVADTYTKSGGMVVSRYLGQVTYRFAISGTTEVQSLLTTPLTFTFADDRGAIHRIPVTLQNFR